MGVFDTCLSELAKQTKAIEALGIPADEIVVRRLPWSDNGTQTVVHRGITFYPLEEQEAPGTNVREDIGYPCGCAIILPADHGTAAHVAKVLDCREKIRRRFIHQRLSGVTLTGGTYLTTKVQHLQINLPREAHRYEVSSLLIRCWMREPRG